MDTSDTVNAVFAKHFLNHYSKVSSPDICSVDELEMKAQQQ